MMNSVKSHFSNVDDLLREAEHGRLRRYGSLLIENSGRIGPIVELLAAAHQFPGEYGAISFAGSFAPKVREAWATGQPFGGGYNDQAGAFPLPRENPVATCDPIWEQWLLHAENVARSKGFDVGLVASLIGALVEIDLTP